MEEEIEERRKYFPRGLTQVEGSFRFSIDAVLLASFAGRRYHKKIIDVGSGCGVIAIALALSGASKNIIALEKEADLVEAGRANVAMLGFEDTIKYIKHDVSEDMQCCAVDAVVCNPPYFSADSGYISPYTLKEVARTDRNLGIFFSFCKKIVKDKGYFYCSFTVSRIHEVLLELEKHSFKVKRMCFIQGRDNKGAKIVLIEARKNAKHGSVVLLPTVVLYNGMSTKYSKHAVEFCPFLAYNME